MTGMPPETLEMPSFERRHITLNSEQLEEIAELAAARAIKKLEERMYQEIGKSVLKKLSWLIGIASVALFLWLQKIGVIRL